MKESLASGIEHEFAFRVPESKTVPNLYPESEEFGAMPEVFATGFSNHPGRGGGRAYLRLLR